MTSEEIRLAYQKAERLGFDGFDVDLDLTPAQNLDMAMYGFAAGVNEWDIFDED